jgi:hypothetical protein
VGTGNSSILEPREGRQNLIPELALVVRYPVPLQEGDEFLLKRNLVVVLIPAANILQHGWYVGLANAEGAVAGLPGEGRQTSRLMNPQGRVGFEYAQRLGHRQRGRTRQKAVNVVKRSARFDHFTAKLANDPAHVSEQIRSELRSEKRPSVMGGEDDVSQQVGKV